MEYTRLICYKCGKIPLILITCVKNGKIYISSKCLCGKNFYDLSSFLYKYKYIENEFRNKSDILFKKLTHNEINYNNEKYEIINNSFMLSSHMFSHNYNEIIKFYCEKCKKNVCDKCIYMHKGHNKNLIDIKHYYLDDTYIKNTRNNFKEINEFLISYLPELKKVLLEQITVQKDKNEIISLSNHSKVINSMLYEILEIIIQNYELNENKSFEDIENYKNNTDFNLFKYKIDLNKIDKERYISYLKNHLLLCCNVYINKLYKKILKSKDEMKKMILDLEPLYEESPNDKNKKILANVKMKNYIFKSNRSIYYGEESNENTLCHGRGILFTFEGSRYFGYFKNDYFKDGFGRYIYNNGNKYIGTFKNGNNDGYGKFCSTSGRVYRGEWKNDKLDGYCNVNWTNGQNFEEEFEQGDFNGIGIIKFSTGTLYQGEFKSGKIEGIGTMLYNDNREYQGEFKDGERGKYGIMTWNQSQQRFMGEWKNEWLDFGLYTWPNGNMYLGDFIEGSITGRGTHYNSATGVIWTGIFKEGRQVENKYRQQIPKKNYLEFI